MRRIDMYKLSKILYFCSSITYLNMLSFSANQVHVLEEHVSELLEVIETHQTLMKKSLVAIAKSSINNIEPRLSALHIDEGTKPSAEAAINIARITEAQAMIARFEVQIQDLENIRDDLRTAATDAYLASDGAREYVVTQQMLIVSNCVNYGLELAEILNEPAHQVIVDKTN
jgi:hypothetical protein